MSLVAIRKACDKPNPSFFAIGSPEWLAATMDFARDILRVLSAISAPRKRSKTLNRSGALCSGAGCAGAPLSMPTMIPVARCKRDRLPGILVDEIVGGVGGECGIAGATLPVRPIAFP